MVCIDGGEPITLLEGGNLTIDRFLGKLSPKSSCLSGGIVMNCNPMTLGHLYLIKEAASQVERLNIFLVSTDLSSFPFKNRFEIVKSEISKLKNVSLFPTGPYQVSSTTFPTYFLKKKDNSTKFQTMLDVTIFAEKFAPYFNIDTRFVGTEPYCQLTLSYNRTMKELLPSYGIKLVEIERKVENGEAISASRVRKLLKEGKIDEAESLLPDSTVEFLRSDEGMRIIQRLKERESVH